MNFIKMDAKIILKLYLSEQYLKNKILIKKLKTILLKGYKQ
jgi:hypothetical protein